MKIDAHTYRLDDAGALGKGSLIIGCIGLVLSVVGYFINAQQFFHSYLVAFVFWVTLGLGGLFFTMIHHLVGASWSVVLRRITETIMVCLPIMVIFFVPILAGLGHLYECVGRR